MPEGDQDQRGVPMPMAAGAGRFDQLLDLRLGADKLERQLMSRREGGSALTQPWPSTLFCGQRLVENVLRDPARFPIK